MGNSGRGSRNDVRRRWMKYGPRVRRALGCKWWEENLPPTTPQQTREQSEEVIRNLLAAIQTLANVDARVRELRSRRRSTIE